MNTAHNQKGFSLVEALLLVLVVTAVAFAGWYVWHADKQDTEKANQAAATKTETATTKPAEDPTKDWTPYTSTAGKYSLRYPTSWLKADHPELCTDGLVLLGPTKASVGACGSDGLGEVSFISSPSGQSFTLDPDFYTDITTVDIKINGVDARKWTGTYSYSGFGVGLPEGTKVVDYVITANDRTYRASYYQAPTFPDVLSDFNLIVYNTLKFN